MSKGWDRELEGGLPDCRLTGHRRRATLVPLGRMMMERVYCANCSADGGLVTAEWTTHVFYLCELCKDKYGALDLPEANEKTVRGQ